MLTWACTWAGMVAHSQRAGVSVRTRMGQPRTCQPGKPPNPDGQTNLLCRMAVPACETPRCGRGYARHSQLKRAASRRWPRVSRGGDFHRQSYMPRPGKPSDKPGHLAHFSGSGWAATGGDGFDGQIAKAGLAAGKRSWLCRQRSLSSVKAECSRAVNRSQSKKDSTDESFVSGTSKQF